LAEKDDFEKKLALILKGFNEFNIRQQRIETEINTLKEQTIIRLDAMKKEIDGLKNDAVITKEIEEGRKRINLKIEENKNNLTDQERKILDDATEIFDKNGEITISALEASNKNLDYKTISGYTTRLIKYGFLRKERDSARRINRYILVQNRK
jgi:hypothetical protein